MKLIVVCLGVTNRPDNFIINTIVYQHIKIYIGYYRTKWFLGIVGILKLSSTFWRFQRSKFKSYHLVGPTNLINFCRGSLSVGLNTLGIRYLYLRLAPFKSSRKSEYTQSNHDWKELLAFNAQTSKITLLHENQTPLLALLKGIKYSHLELRTTGDSEQTKFI